MNLPRIFWYVVLLLMANIWILKLTYLEYINGKQS